MKYLNYILIAMLPLLCTACWTILQPGTVKGPIVNDPPDPEDRLPSGEMAATHMTTSLVMKCPAITASGNQKPVIINDFVVSHRKVNHLQMKVWRSLINMNMIKPVSDIKEKPAFTLLSDIKALPDKVKGKTKYSWIMYMEKTSDKKEVWREKVEFGE